MRTKTFAILAATLGVVATVSFAVLASVVTTQAASEKYTITLTIEGAAPDGAVYCGPINWTKSIQVQADENDVSTLYYNPGFSTRGGNTYYIARFVVNGIAYDARNVYYNGEYDWGYTLDFYHSEGAIVQVHTTDLQHVSLSLGSLTGDLTITAYTALIGTTLPPYVPEPDPDPECACPCIGCT